MNPYTATLLEHNKKLLVEDGFRSLCEELRKTLEASNLVSVHWEDRDLIAAHSVVVREFQVLSIAAEFCFTPQFAFESLLGSVCRALISGSVIHCTERPLQSIPSADRDFIRFRQIFHTRGSIVFPVQLIDKFLRDAVIAATNEIPKAQIISSNCGLVETIVARISKDIEAARRIVRLLNYSFLVD
jgi:hypothetical protein